MQNDLLELRGAGPSRNGGNRGLDQRYARTRGQSGGGSESVNTGNSGPNMDRIQQTDFTNGPRSNRTSWPKPVRAVPRRMAWVQFPSCSRGFLGMGAGLMARSLSVADEPGPEREQRKLLDDKLRAEKIVAEKSAFLANISHEIRTPMNAILGFGELLEYDSLTPGQAQYVKSIRQSGMSLLQLINDVLDLSKLEAGKLDIHHEPTDLMEICNFLQTMFSQQAAARSPCSLNSTPPACPTPCCWTVCASARCSSTGWATLSSSPRKDTSRRAREWTQDTGDGSRGTLLIHVEDTGVGVSPEKQEEIFKPFVQSESSSSRVNEGTGLGLHIVQLGSPRSRAVPSPSKARPAAVPPSISSFQRFPSPHASRSPIAPTKLRRWTSTTLPSPRCWRWMTTKPAAISSPQHLRTVPSAAPSWRATAGRRFGGHCRRRAQSGVAGHSHARHGWPRRACRHPQAARPGIVASDRPSPLPARRG